MSLICSGFSPVNDVREQQPHCCEDRIHHWLSLILDNGGWPDPLHVSHLTVWGYSPDITPHDLKACFDLIQTLLGDGRLLAYHDRSDGGLLATVSEMLFASRLGLNARTPEDVDPITFWFNEEIGCVIEISNSDLDAVINECTGAGLSVHVLGELDPSDSLLITQNKCS